jgi:hypothetical protein
MMKGESVRIFSAKKNIFRIDLIDPLLEACTDRLIVARIARLSDPVVLSDPAGQDVGQDNAQQFHHEDPNSRAYINYVRWRKIDRPKSFDVQVRKYRKIKKKLSKN